MLGGCLNCSIFGQTSNRLLADGVASPNMLGSVSEHLIGLECDAVHRAVEDHGRGHAG